MDFQWVGGAAEEQRRPLYEDRSGEERGLTIDVSLPEAYSLQAVSDTLIRLCLEIEDELGVTILAQASRLPHKV